MKTALLVGATGLVGGLVLEQLLADTYFEKVIVLTRKSLGKSNAKLKEVLISMIITNCLFWLILIN